MAIPLCVPSVHPTIGRSTAQLRTVLPCQLPVQLGCRAATQLRAFPPPPSPPHTRWAPPQSSSPAGACAGYLAATAAQLSSESTSCRTTPASSAVGTRTCAVGRVRPEGRAGGQRGHARPLLAAHWRGRLPLLPQAPLGLAPWQCISSGCFAPALPSPYCLLPSPPSPLAPAPCCRARAAWRCRPPRSGSRW